MTSYYQKINTIFLRDQNPGKYHNCIMPDKGFTQPEFEYLKDCKFECTEKIDGTCMCVHLVPDECNQIPEGEVPVRNPKTGEVSLETRKNVYKIDYRMEIHGKTENSVIPKHLLAKMESIFTVDKLVAALKENTIFETFDEALKEMTEGRVIVFGEGYGMKIQKGGNYISNDCGFILFDVRCVGYGGVWLLRNSLEDIARKLDIPIVPLIGYMTVDEAIEYVRKGFKSTISENRDYDAEGLVLKSPIGLLNRNGERIITKIKTCDFRQLEARERSIKD